MQANKIMEAIIIGCKEENSLMTMWMMSVWGEGALDMYLLHESGGRAKWTLLFFFIRRLFPLSG